MKQIQHWKCSVCGRQLTYLTEDDRLEEVSHHTHFDISRSNKQLEIEEESLYFGVSSYIEERIEDRNTKMEMQLCEECFNQVLNESKTLGKLFDTPNGRIY